MPHIDQRHASAVKVEAANCSAPCPHVQAVALDEVFAVGGFANRLQTACTGSQSTMHRNLPGRPEPDDDTVSNADSCSTHAWASDIYEDEANECAHHLGVTFDRSSDEEFEKAASLEGGYATMLEGAVGSEQCSQVGEAYNQNEPESRTMERVAAHARAKHETEVEEQREEQRRPDTVLRMAETTTSTGDGPTPVEVPAMQISNRGHRSALGGAFTEVVPAQASGQQEHRQKPKVEVSGAEAGPRPSESAAAGTGISGLEDASQGGCKIAKQPLAPLRALPFQLRCKQRPPEVSKLSPGLRVAIIVNGSQGDVRPLIALSRQLTLFRHTVRILTSVNLVDLCVEHGVEAVPVFADMQAVITSMGGMAGMQNELSRGIQAAKDWLAGNKEAWVSPEVALAEYKPEAIIAGPQANCIAGRYEAEFGVPVLPVFFSRYGYEIFEDFTSIKPARPALLASSVYLDPKRKGSVEHLHQTGEWVLYEAPSDQALTGDGPLAALRGFLGTGPAPVAVGWGSMTAHGMTPMEMLRLALRALQAAGRRGVILGGWAELDKLASQLLSSGHGGVGGDAAELAAFAAREVCFVNSAPHEWLFPQCCAVVHHGGAGTWQTAVRAGLPAVITPVFGDQYPHAAAAERLGVAVSFRKPLPEIGAAELAGAIGRAERKAAAAEALGRRVRGQVGEREGAEVVNSFLREQVRTGKWGRSKKALAAQQRAPGARCRR